MFLLMLRTIIYFHVYIILDFPITYRMLRRFANQNAHAYIKQLKKFSLLKVMKIPTQKGEH